MSELRIDDIFLTQHLLPEQMDEMWAAGWRHQGSLFFRYSHWPTAGVEHQIMPVRIDLSRFTPSKSQRRVRRKNEDLQWTISPTEIDQEMITVFEKHSTRFHENVPQSIFDFLGFSPATKPCECLMLKALLNGRMIAVSFMDLGERDVSSSYAIFDPEFSDRGLGTLTLLREIEHATSLGKRYLYHGYATRTPSHYDYKKTFNALESYDWATQTWSPCQRYIIPPTKREIAPQSVTNEQVAEKIAARLDEPGDDEGIPF